MKTYDEYCGIPLAALPHASYLVDDARVRPTIKALVVLRAQRLFVSYRSVRNGKFNLPGGGIEHHQWVSGLYRELKEEVPQYPWRYRELVQAPVAVAAEVPTNRDGYTHKLLVIVVVVIPATHSVQYMLQPDQRELMDLQLRNYTRTCERICRYGTPKPMHAYTRAINWARAEYLP